MRKKNPDTERAARALANTAWRAVYGGRAPWTLPTAPALATRFPDAPKPVLAGAVRILRERTRAQREKRDARSAARFGPTDSTLRERLRSAVITTFDRAFAAAGFRQPAGDEHLCTDMDNALAAPTIDTKRRTRWSGRSKYSRLDVERRIRVPSRWLGTVHREGLAHALGERTLVIDAQPVTSALVAVTYWKQGRGVGTTTAQTRVYRDPMTGAWKEAR